MWSQACVTTHGGALESHRSDPGGILRPPARQGPLPPQHEVGTRWHLFSHVSSVSLRLVNGMWWCSCWRRKVWVCVKKIIIKSLRRIEQASACFHTSVRSSVIKMQKSLWVARMTGGMWSKPHSQSSLFVSSLFHTVPLYLLLISSKALSSRFGEIFLLFESILCVRLKTVLRWRDEKWNDFM